MDGVMVMIAIFAAVPTLLVIGFSFWSFVTWQINWAVVRGCACAIVLACATIAAVFRRKR